MPVAEGHDIREFLVAEIVRAQPRIEPRKTEVHRVGAVRHRGAQAVPPAGRREQFGMFGICGHALIFTRSAHFASAARIQLSRRTRRHATLPP